jgi:hypothetical protein
MALQWPLAPIPRSSPRHSAILAVAIYVAAFALSLIATVVTLQRKRVEEERTPRVARSRASGG